MAGEQDRPTESQITADVDAVRAWAEAHGQVPVRDDGRPDVVPAADRPPDAEELSWDEFDDALSREDKLVVRHGDVAPDLEVVDRSAVLGRATVETEGVEDPLLDGRTVETDVTERTVVEHTVVQEATVESAVGDRELLETDVVDVRLLSTDVDHCTVSRTVAPPETPETVRRFEPGSHTEEAYEVEVAVDETWALTREVVERITIESRIVETDVDEAETVATDTVHGTIDVDGVTETVLEGELVAAPETDTETITGHVESEFREDDVLETILVRRQRIEEEMAVRKVVSGEISDAETVDTRALSATVVESEVVDVDEYERAVAGADRRTESGEATGREPGEVAGESGDEATAAVDAPTETPDTSEPPTGTAEQGPLARPSEPASPTDESREVDVEGAPASTEPTEVGTEAGPAKSAETGETTRSGGPDPAAGTGVEGGGSAAEGPTPGEDDVGKTAVDRSGEEIGTVVAVEDGRTHVDPNPTVLDRVRTALGWGGADEDDVVVHPDNVQRIDDDEVVVDVDRDERRDADQ